MLHRRALGFDLGSSDNRKNAWYSTHIFQKALQASLLAMVNSSVSLHSACVARDKNRGVRGVLGQTLPLALAVLSWAAALAAYRDLLTEMFAWSLMRKCFLLKLSLRILDQLNVLIFVLPCKDGHSSYTGMGQDAEIQLAETWAPRTPHEPFLQLSLPLDLEKRQWGFSI